MSFAKNVTKYQKWVLGGIVALLAFALVIPNTIGNSDDSETKVHATIFGDVQVTEREWREALSKSGAWFRLKAVRDIDQGTDYTSIQMREYLFKFRDGPGLLAFHDPFKPSQDDYTANARELIILGYDAKSKQVRASEEEIDDIIRGFLERAGIGEHEVEKQATFSQQFFLADRESFRAAVRDSILIERSLSLDVGGSHARYEEIFNEKLSSARSAKVLVAGIDGNRLPNDLTPVTDDQIRSKYAADLEKDADAYKVPEKVQIEFLTANFEDFKAKLKEPTPDEIQKYYDEHKREFLKPPAVEEGHHEGDGHQHDPPKDEFKPVADVREEIIKKIKDQQAFREAWTLMSDLNSKVVSARLYKLKEEEKVKEPKDTKAVQDRVRARTGTILTELRDEQKAKGIELRTGTTLPFGTGDREPFTQELGKFSGTGTDPSSTWTFEGPVGEIANQIYRSDKGLSIIRIAKKIESYATDLTAPIREKIRQDLLKEGAAGRARRLADELVARIREKGAPEIAKLKSRTDLKIQHSAYLSQTTQDADSGLAPNALAQQVKSKVLDPKRTTTTAAAEAEALYGDAVGGERKDWSYVVVVEDAVTLAPDVKDEEFLGEVRQKEREAVLKARSNHAAKLVASAEWKDAAKAPAQ